jgi:hypothetical protein
MIIKDEKIVAELEKHIINTVTVVSYYDGEKIGEDIFWLKCGDTLTINHPSVEVFT